MTPEEKSQATLMWVLTLIPLGIISPIIFMIVGKEKPGVYRSSMQALTYCICLIIAYIALWVLIFLMAIVTHGFGALLAFPLVAVVGLFTLYVLISGIIAANKGEVYEPPFTSQFAKKWFNV